MEVFSYDIKDYEDKGLTGLCNLGNTCFLNSLMQILSHTYELSEFLNKETYKEKLNRKPDTLLLLEWDKLRKLMWSQNCVISPGAFVQTIQKVAKHKKKDIFTGWAQNDLPEFLLFLLEAFHISLMREVEMNIKGTIENKTDKLAKICYEMMKTMYRKEYSELLSIFYGIHVSKLQMPTNEVPISLTPEPFLMIDLPLHPKKQPNIYDCLDLYCEKELLDGDNAVYNDKLQKKVDAEKSIIFWSLPSILIISLKRFTKIGRKDNTLVDFPLTDLKLSKYVKGYNRDSYIYDLYGICNHSGNVLGGHYTSFVCTANGKWYHFNDTNVTLVDRVEKIVSPASYCLFYRKKK